MKFVFPNSTELIIEENVVTLEINTIDIKVISFFTLNEFSKILERVSNEMTNTQMILLKDENDQREFLENKHKD